MTKRMFWEAGVYKIYVYGNTDDECWASLKKLLRGECAKYFGEWDIEDAPDAVVMWFSPKKT